MISPLLHDDAPSLDHPPSGQSNLPLSDDETLVYDPVAIRDELNESQSAPDAVRRVSARHLSRLIYSLEYGPDAVEEHIAPYITEQPEHRAE